MKSIRIHTTPEHPTGLVVDEHGVPVPGIYSATVRLAVGQRPTAQLHLNVGTSDVVVDGEDVRWYGLDQVPVEALRAELARREQVTG
ncbi:hypothetical protein [Umezawaea beigongshangensis]|uniref:hypothetical protein n=1 Tax=Umezawaea beigongshangensis TaxID=2780383 RepID=UPI0018F22A45|nr:hypothetical protein [Umezawaea beigongshangensis]